MTFKRFPENHFERMESSNFLIPNSPALQEFKPSQFILEKKENKHRKIIPFILFTLCSFGAYYMWDSFVRYDAHGIVEANIIGIYSLTEGTINNLSVTTGDYIKKNQKVVEVINSNDHRELLRLKDEIKTTEAELSAQQSQLRWKRGSNQETYHKAVSELAIEEGNLGDLKAKSVMLKSNLNRLKSIRAKGAVSLLEVEKAEAEYFSNQALISSKINTISAMKTRVENSHIIIEDDGEIQILPLIQKINYLKNEISRLNQKINEGIIYSPVNGTVSTIIFHYGEKVISSSEPIFRVIEENSSKFVLYFKTDQKLPEIGETIEIWSPTNNKYITAEVIGFSKDAISAPDQIKRYYSQDEKLLRVFLTPIGVDINNFIVGETIKKPTGLGIIANWIAGNNAHASKRSL